MAALEAIPGNPVGAPTARRWWQLIFGVISMSMVANLQYGWTLFVDPINDKHHWGRAAIQVAFTIFVLVETWLVPLEGYLVDRFGPTFVGAASGVLVAGAWVLNSAATSLPMLYLRAVIGGPGSRRGHRVTPPHAPQPVASRRGL